MKAKAKKTQTQQLTPLVKAAIESNEWNYDFDPRSDQHDGDIFNLGIRGENVNIRVLIVVDNEDGRLMVRCSPNWYVPADRRELALHIINSMNNDKWFTRVSMDMDDGELYFIQTLQTFGIPHTEESIKEFIFLSLGVADDETRTIMERIFSGSRGSGSDSGNPGPDDDSGHPSIDINWTPRGDN